MSSVKVVQKICFISLESKNYNVYNKFIGKSICLVLKLYKKSVLYKIEKYYYNVYIKLYIKSVIRKCNR